MMSTIKMDQGYSWRGLGDGSGRTPSSCRVRVFQPHPEQTVVVLSDMGIGASITNSIEYILLPIAQKFGVDAVTTLWIEHYPCHRASDPDVEFSRIHPTIRVGNRVAVTWSPLSRNQAEQLCGSSLE